MLLLCFLLLSVALNYESHEQNDEYNLTSLKALIGKVEGGNFSESIKSTEISLKNVSPKSRSKRICLSTRYATLKIKVLVRALIDDYGLLKSVDPFDGNENSTSNFVNVAIKNSVSCGFVLQLSLANLNITSFGNGWNRLPSGSVTRLDVSENKIVQVTKQLLNDLKPKIVEVWLGGNQIERLERGIMENRNPIRLFDLQRNKISVIDDGALEKLNLIDELDLTHNRLSNMKFMGTLPPKIIFLYLQHNIISEISVGNFSTLTDLKYLDLSWNKITKLTASQNLCALSSLKNLFLRSNGLTTIEPGFFQGLIHLDYLDLFNNNISSLKTGVFSELTAIYAIDMSHNLFTTITSGMFSVVPDSLYYLDLENNQISEIEKGAFYCPNLYGLNLKNNSLEGINKNTFEGLERLDYLYLNWNKIKTVNRGTTTCLKSLAYINLGFNPIMTMENGSLSGFSQVVGSIREANLRGIPAEVIHPGIFEEV